MIERVERYVFTVRPGQADLIHRWAGVRGQTPEKLAYELMMIGVSVAAAHQLGWTPPGRDAAADEGYQAEALAALREELGLAQQDET